MLHLDHPYEREVEILARKILDEGGPRALEIFQAMARTYIFLVLHPPETTVEEWEGYKITKFKERETSL